jgi:hypothetical protein
MKKEFIERCKKVKGWIPPPHLDPGYRLAKGRPRLMRDMTWCLHQKEYVEVLQQEHPCQKELAAQVASLRLALTRPRSSKTVAAHTKVATLLISLPQASGVVFKAQALVMVVSTVTVKVLAMPSHVRPSRKLLVASVSIYEVVKSRSICRHA